jgi:hypothetical protein
MSGKPTILFSGAKGLNTVLDPQRLSQGTRQEPGMVELAVAVNVSIDEQGLVSLRLGDTSKQSGEFHSLFCAGGDCFVIQERQNDAAIMQVATDYSLAGVRSGLTKNLPMSFAQVNEDTYYSNGAQNGVITGGVSAAWPINTYNGPETNLNFEGAPAGNIIAHKPGGQMLIAEGPTVWINHEPYAFGLFNKRSGFISFATDVTMMCPVKEGWFISDSKATWFLRGTSWFDFIQIKVADYPALKWSLAHDPVSLADMKVAPTGLGRMWASTEGLCLGLDDGTLINLTKDPIKYPSGYTTGACLVTDSHLIHTVYE